LEAALWKKRLKNGFPFALPTLVSFAIAFLVPFAMGLYLSLCKFKTVKKTEFVGFDNYIKAFSNDKDFLNALWFTTKFTIVSVITINLIAFIFESLKICVTRGVFFSIEVKNRQLVIITKNAEATKKKINGLKSLLSS